jgi:tRNA threonylcarbamoyladenosine modification (KEOPS) complex Cgi121 subunit
VKHLPSKISHIKAEDLLKRVTIRGLRDVNIQDLDALISAVPQLSGGMEVQLFDADRTAGKRHLQLAALNALKAFQGGYNVAKSVAVETLRFASAQMQIGKAFKIAGLTSQTRNLAILIIKTGGGNVEEVFANIQRLIGGTPDDAVLKIDSEAKLNELTKLYEITSQALMTRSGDDRREAVIDLIVERMAILATGR